MADEIIKYTYMPIKQDTLTLLEMIAERTKTSTEKVIEILVEVYLTITQQLADRS